MMFKGPRFSVEKMILTAHTKPIVGLGPGDVHVVTCLDIYYTKSLMI